MARSRYWKVDGRTAGLVLAATGLTLANLAFGWVPTHADARAVDAFTFALTAVAVLSLALWRTAPGIALVITMISSVIHGLAGYPPHIGQLAIFINLYFFARAARQNAAEVVASVVLVTLGFAVLVFQMVESVTVQRIGFYGLFALPVVPVLLARVGQANDARRSELEARLVATEAAKTAEAERLLTEQRLAIARDVHDSVAQSVAAVAVQSAAALAVFDTDPPAARQALAAIRETTQAVIADTKSTLQSLRQTAPEAGMALADTAATARSAGLDVTVTDTAGEHLTPPVRYALQRIAQESVSNVLRHSNADQLTIDLSIVDEVIILVVTDNGTVCEQPPTAGHGLTGMAERVELLNGHIRTGPRPAGGFEVRASVPTGRAAP